MQSVSRFRNFIKSYDVLEVSTKNQAKTKIFTDSEKEVGNFLKTRTMVPTPLKATFPNRSSKAYHVKSFVWLFSITFSAQSHEKHLVIEQLPWRRNKRYLIDFKFLETLEDAPSTHKNFTLLGQGNDEIPGGSARTPLVSDVGTKTLGIRKFEIVWKCLSVISYTRSFLYGTKI